MRAVNIPVTSKSFNPIFSSFRRQNQPGDAVKGINYLLSLSLIPTVRM